MEVFISWSGDRSEKVAEALRDWLPSVIQSVNPFMSASDIEQGSRWLNDLGIHLENAQFGLICLTQASDIEQGSRWLNDLGIHLENAQFGLICLTQENLKAPWLLFEAGALSKSIENSRVVPYLYGFSQAQLQGPLAQFQAAAADKSSTLEVMKSINGALEENGLDPARLERTFETWWPHLEQALGNIPESTEEAPPSRTDRDILEEVLGLCRQMSRQGAPNSDLEPEIWGNLIAHGSLTRNAPSTPEPNRLTIGSRIRHPTFGVGTVQEVEGHGDDQQAVIDFGPKNGTKRILVSVAKLEMER